jgi:FkbM family methyltransferase
VFVARIKHLLVGLGPASPLVRIFLRAAALARGFGIRFQGRRIELRRGKRSLFLSAQHFVQVPLMMKLFADYFATIQPRTVAGREVLDFSQPGFHTYRKHGVGFFFPSIPEDDSMPAYLRDYQPRPGDCVWDVGAHAGASTFFLSRLVGPAGRVIAFEPDQRCCEFLEQNITLHALENVRVVKKALCERTGEVAFNMDGTMAAGLSDRVLYASARYRKLVPAITIADACAELGSVPSYIKMDIEGAEVGAIEGSLRFLALHPIHFALESGHLVHGRETYAALERLFPPLGYRVHSRILAGQRFTWAAPGPC